MVKRILFLVVSPFEKRDFDRFGTELLQQNGFQVDVWDVTFIIRPGLLQEKSLTNTFNYEGLTVFFDKQELYNKLINLTKEDFVINFPSYSYLTLHIYRALSKSRANYAVFMSNVLPTFRRSVSSGNIFLRLKNLHPLTPEKIWKVIFIRLPFHWYGIRPATLILAGGKKFFSGCYPINGETEILQCHALDYDLYLKEISMPSNEKSIAVFLDQNIPFHRDYVFSNEKPYISAGEYYPLLNKIFCLIKNELGLKVVIAAHPRSQDDINSNFFNGFECVKGKVVELIRNSKFVLSHGSTALNIANLFYKPVIFLTCSKFDNNLAGRGTQEMSKWFGKKPIYMDEDIDINWEEELKVDKNIYDHYRRSYIKKEGSEELPFWQIVANRLKKGFE